MTTVTRSRKEAADKAAMALLVPESQRVEFEIGVKSLIARNSSLGVIESVREQEQLSKKALADRAGLDASAVRKLLTSKTANPTTENVFRLMGALGIHVEAVTPKGERISLI